MSDTPRTDAQLQRISIKNEDESCAIHVHIGGKEYDGALVDADFARQLERELAEAKTENARLQMELDASCNAEELRQVRAELAAMRAERDALREALIERAEEHGTQTDAFMGAGDADNAEYHAMWANRMWRALNAARKEAQP